MRLTLELRRPIRFWDVCRKIDDPRCTLKRRGKTTQTVDIDQHQQHQHHDASTCKRWLSTKTSKTINLMISMERRTPKL